MLKRNKPDNSCPSSVRLSDEVMADDRDDYEFLMQASTVSKFIYKTNSQHSLNHHMYSDASSQANKGKDAKVWL